MTMDGGSCVSMPDLLYDRADACLGEKSGSRTTVAGRSPVANGVSRRQERARGDAAEGAEFRIHMGLVVVLRIERHVRQPRPPCGLQLTECSMEAHDARVELRLETDLISERLHQPRLREPGSLAQRCDRDRAAA